MIHIPLGGMGPNIFHVAFKLNDCSQDSSFWCCWAWIALTQSYLDLKLEVKTFGCNCFAVLRFCFFPSWLGLGLDILTLEQFRVLALVLALELSSAWISSTCCTSVELILEVELGQGNAWTNHCT